MNEASLCLDGIVVRYRLGASNFVAVENVSLETKSGERVMLLGPSGWGKSSLLKVIAGFQKPAAGRSLQSGPKRSRKPLGIHGQIGFTTKARTYEELTWPNLQGGPRPRQILSLKFPGIASSSHMSLADTRRPLLSLTRSAPVACRS